MMRNSLRIAGFLFCILGSVNETLAQLTLYTNLQACYNLDCPADSIVQNGAVTGPALNGVRRGNITCTTGHNGLPGTAALFGGTMNDYIKLVDNPLIKPTTSLTVAGWFYVTSNNMQDLIFIKNTCNFNFNSISIITYNGTFQIYKRPGTPGSCGSGNNAATASYPLNGWHHVVFYADNSFLKVSVDNTAPIVTAHNIVFDYDTTAVILGATNEMAANNPFSGKMDNLKFWNRELSAAEIISLYQHELSCKETNPVSLLSGRSEPLELILYPNPADQKLSLKNPGNHTIHISDLAGKQLDFTSFTKDDGLTEINLSAYTSGIYLVQLKDKDGTILASRKLVLTR